MNKEEYKDYLKLSGKITEKLDNTATYENWLIIQEYIDRAQQKVEQLENIIKEAIEYIKNNKETREHYEPYETPMGNSNYTTTHIFGYYELLDILNKGE